MHTVRQAHVQLPCYAGSAATLAPLLFPACCRQSAIAGKRYCLPSISCLECRTWRYLFLHPCLIASIEFVSRATYDTVNLTTCKCHCLGRATKKGESDFSVAWVTRGEINDGRVSRFSLYFATRHHFESSIFPITGASNNGEKEVLKS